MCPAARSPTSPAPGTSCSWNGRRTTPGPSPASSWRTLARRAEPAPAADSPRTGPDRTGGAGPSQHEFEALVAGGEAEPGVEAERAGPALVAGELDEDGAAAAGLGDGPPDHGFAESLTAVWTGHPDRLELGSQGALPGQAGDEGELHGGGYLAGRVLRCDHDEELGGAGVDRGERPLVNHQAAAGEILPGAAQVVVGQQGDQGGH